MRIKNFFAVFFFLSLVILPAASMANEQPSAVVKSAGGSVDVDGRKFTFLVAPRPSGSDFYVAIFDLSRITGCTYISHPGSGTLTIKKGSRSLELTIDKTQAVINSILTTALPPPTEVDGIEYVPFKLCASGLGYSVSADSSGPSFTLKYNPAIKIAPGTAADSPDLLLPQGASFIPAPSSAADTSGATPCKWGDLNASFYKSGSEKYGLLLFSGKDKKYQKLWQKEELFPPDLLETADFGGSKPFLMAGWNMGSPLGSYIEIYSIGENSLDVVFTGMYSKIETGDYDSDGKNELAIWQKDIGETYSTTVYKWSGNSFTPLEYCPDYFKKVTEFYNSQPAGASSAGAVCWRKAEACLRAKIPDLALKYSLEGESLSSDYPSKNVFLGLKGIALVEMNNYSESLPLLESALKGYPGPLWPEARFALSRCYFEKGNRHMGLITLSRALSEGSDWGGFGQACSLFEHEQNQQ